VDLTRYHNRVFTVRRKSNWKEKKRHFQF